MPFTLIFLMSYTLKFLVSFTLIFLTSYTYVPWYSLCPVPWYSLCLVPWYSLCPLPWYSMCPIPWYCLSPIPWYPLYSSPWCSWCSWGEVLSRGSSVSVGEAWGHSRSLRSVGTWHDCTHCSCQPARWQSSQKKLLFFVTNLLNILRNFFRLQVPKLHKLIL